MKRLSFVTPVIAALSVVAVTLPAPAGRAVPQGHIKSKQRKPDIKFQQGKPALPKRSDVDSGMVERLSQWQAQLDRGMVMGLNKNQEQMFNLKNSPDVVVAVPFSAPRLLPPKK